MVEWLLPGIQFRASRISPKNGFFSSYFDILNDFPATLVLGKKFEIP